MAIVSATDFTCERNLFETENMGYGDDNIVINANPRSKRGASDENSKVCLSLEKEMLVKLTRL